MPPIVVDCGVRFLLLLVVLVGCGDAGDDMPTPVAPTDRVYVDAAALPGGNGAEGTPFRTVEEAVASEIPHIVVRPGTYMFPPEWTVGKATVIEAPDGAFVTGTATWTVSESLEVSGFEIFAQLDLSGQVALRDVKLTGEQSGLRLASGPVDVANVAVEGAGMHLDGCNGVFSDVRVASAGGLTVERGEVDFTGLTLVSGGASFTGATATLTGVEATDVTAPVVAVSDSTVTMRESTLTNVQADGDGAGDGVVLDSGELTLEMVTVTNPADRAFVARGGMATLRGVTLSGGGRPPVSVLAQAEVTVVASEIFGAGTCLFATDGGTLRVQDSHIHDCQFGVLAGMGADVTLQKNRVMDCSGGHFSALNDGTKVLFEENEVRGAEATCVALAGTNGPDVVIRNNTVDDCVGQGISLLNLTGAVIADNEVSSVTADPVFTDVGDGIGLVDAFADVTGNTVTGAEKRGIGLLRSGGTYDGNAIRQSGDLGISVVDPAGESVTIRNNEIEGAVGGGIAVLNADASVEGNQISDIAANPELGTGDGITFGLGSNSTVTGNTVTNAAFNGIVFAEGATGSIENNTVSGSGRHGIREYCISETNDVTVGDNTLSENALGDTQLCE